MNPGHRPAVQRAAAAPATVRRIAASAAAAALVALPACAADACSERGERRLARLVELVIDEPGPTADAAEEALVAAGPAAILYLETGLYDAEPDGRRRLARILARIGDREGQPILVHLARHDPDPDVRAEAAAGARALLGAGADRSPAEDGSQP
jgi:HEAT repeat protein